MGNKYLRLSERNKNDIILSMPEDRQMSKLASYFQNFADGTRLKILTCLAMSPLCVNDISNLLGINQTTISHQLKLLKDQGFVEYKREGKVLIYSIIEDSVNNIMNYAVLR